MRAKGAPLKKAQNEHPSCIMQFHAARAYKDPFELVLWRSNMLRVEITQSWFSIAKNIWLAKKMVKRNQISIPKNLNLPTELILYSNTPILWVMPKNENQLTIKGVWFDPALRWTTGFLSALVEKAFSSSMWSWRRPKLPDITTLKTEWTWPLSLPCHHRHWWLLSHLFKVGNK